MAAKKNFSSTLAAVEKQKLGDAAQRRTELDVATERARDTQADLEAARLRLAEIGSAFEALDESYTAQDYAQAGAELARAERRAEGAVRQREAAAKAIGSTDTEVAEVAAQVLRAAYPGVPVYATFLRSTDAPADDERPAFVVRQVKPSEYHDGGAVRGPVEVTYYRTRLHTGLSTTAIENAAEDLSVGLRVHGGMVSLGATEDNTRLIVDFAYPELPILDAIASEAPMSLARGVAAAIAGRARMHGALPQLDRETGAYVTQFVTALPHRASVVSELVDDVGVRTVVIEAVALVRVDEMPSSPVSEHIERALGDIERQRHMSGLGSIVGVERAVEEEVLLPLDVAERAVASVNPSNLPREASKIRFATVEQVIVRATFQSRTRVSGNLRMAS